MYEKIRSYMLFLFQVNIKMRIDIDITFQYNENIEYIPRVYLNDKFMALKTLGCMRAIKYTPSSKE